MFGDYGGDQSEYSDYSSNEDWEERPNPRIDTHLNSPIRTSYIHLINESIKLYPRSEFDHARSSKDLPYVKLPKSTREIGDSLIRLFDNNKTLCQECIQWDPSPILGLIYQSAYTDNITTDLHKNSNYQVIIESLSRIMMKFDPRLDKELISEVDRDFTVQERKAYSVKLNLEKMKEEAVRLAEKKSNQWVMRKTGVRQVPYFLVSRSMCVAVKTNAKLCKESEVTPDMMQVLIDAKSEFFAMTYDHLLCIQDTYTSRVLCLYASRIMSPVIEFRVEPTLLARIYSIFDKEFANKGNSIFKEVKLFEGLMHGLLIFVNDTLSTKRDFLDTILAEADSIGSTAIREIYELMVSQSSTTISEIYGLYRHWGHPIIDEAAGCEALHKIILTRATPDPEIVTQVAGCLIKQFCVHYIQKNSHWPPCDTSYLPASSTLRLLIDRNERRMNLHAIPIPLNEWSLVRINGALQFDYSTDYGQLLGDKAIAPMLSDERSYYNAEMMGVKHKTKMSTSRRLLTEVINTSTIDTEALCKRISARDVPSDWFHIKLAPKEREVNTTPRLFAMMVMYMRLFFCLLESNISKSLFPFYPQQSMNNSEEKLNRRLIAMSSTAKTESYVDVIIGVDFSKWNIHWSIFNTAPFTTILDGMFGLQNLFTFGHEFFSRAIVSLNSPFHIPREFMSDPSIAEHIKTKYRWNYHLGGLEGIMQKLWTWITIGILLLVEKNTGISAEIVGQGDNQVCKIRIYIKDNNKSREDVLKDNDAFITGEARRFLKELDRISSAMGLKIKILESWISDSVMNYGKQLFVHGACMPQLLKRISRVLSDVNENFPTLPLKVGSLQSAGYSSAQKTYTVALPYFISTLESCITLTRDFERLLNRPSNRTNLFALSRRDLLTKKKFWYTVLLAPSELSTLPFINLLQYDYRGAPDDFTTYTTFLWKLLSNNECPDVHEVATKMWLALDNEKFDYGRPSEELLVTNPCSVNFQLPDRPATEFKRLVEDYLTAHAKNIDIKDLFHITNREEDQVLYKYLLTLSPVMPRLLEILSSNSVTGTRRYIVSKFTLTKTLQKDAGLYNNMTSSEYIEKFDVLTITHLMTIYFIVAFTTIPETFALDCPTKLAHKIRVNSHAGILNGRDILGITVPHPAHVLEIVYDDCSDRKEYVSLFCPQPITTKSILESGDQPAYVGSRTQEKTSGKIISVGVKSRPLTGACRISQMQKWAVQPDSQAWKFSDNLIAQRTNMPGHMLRQISGEVTTGSALHRMRDAIIKKATANNFPHSFTTHFAFSSDKLDITVRGGDDYNIHINGLVHHLLRDALKTVLTSDAVTVTYVRGYRVNNCCHRELDAVLVNSDEPAPALRTNHTNKLVYAPISQFSEIYVPRTVFIQTVDSVSQEHAIAYYMMQRFRASSSVVLIDGAQSKSPYLTRVSLSEILNTGLPRLIRAYARCLYLYLGDSKESIIDCVSRMQVDQWCGLVDAALGPNILPEVLEVLKIDGIAGAYTSRAAVCRRLCDMLLEEIQRISRSPDKEAIYRRFEFFLTPNIKLPNILMMWNFMNYECNKYHTSLFMTIKQLIYKSMRDHIPWNETLRDIMNAVLKQDESCMAQGELLHDLIGTSRVLLVNGPPESYFRQKRYRVVRVEEPSLKIPSPEIQLMIYDSNYTVPPYTAFREHDSDTILASSQSGIYRETEIYITPRRKRLDQAYRLVGTTSTGHYKLSQIMMVEQLDVSHMCIALADGEGSMAKYMSRASGKPVIYNSKRDEGQIITQRYEHYVPANFANERDMIIGAEYCMLYGGDLTDPVYVDKLTQILPPLSSIITCDAETSGSLASDLRLSILYTTLYAARRSGCQVMIMKIFLDNIPLCSIMVSAALQYYHELRVIVPDYSSNESSEAYMVASKPVDSNPYDTFQDWTSVLRIESNWSRHGESLLRLKMDKMSRGVPLMLGKERLLSLYYKLGIDSGFHDNFTESISKLFGSYFRTILTPTNIRQKLMEVQTRLVTTATKTVESYACLLQVQDHKPAWNACLNISNGTPVSHMLKTECDRIVCAAALRVILEEPSLLVAADLYWGFINEHHAVLKVREIEVYDYSVHHRCLEWESMYLKHIWRVFGHVHLR